MSGSNVYDELVEHLNSMPVGAPKTPELIEILKTIYTDEEAALAPKLPFLPCVGTYSQRQCGRWPTRG